MESRKQVAILLAAYNGERFLADQIESIQRQTLTEWTLYVRDDGSRDGTVGLVTALAAADPRIVLLEDEDRNLGPMRNFARLLERACEQNDQYVFFADQDDVWLPDKMSRQMELMRQTEAAYSAEAPILVHSDLMVCDERLNVVAESFIGFSRIYRNSNDPLRTLLLQNFVTGCTMLINRPLLAASLPMPDVALMHDWWLALCAASTGRVVFHAAPTVSYRQHSSNTVGASRYSPIKAILKRVVRPDEHRQALEFFETTVAQGLALRRHLNQLEHDRHALAAETGQAGSPPHVESVWNDYLAIVNREASPWRRFCEVRKFAFPEASQLRRLWWSANVALDELISERQAA